jgi:hypothetical protein
VCRLSAWASIVSRPGLTTNKNHTPRIRAGGQATAVAPGALIFVEKSVEHRFIDITEDLTVLVFFAPPEGSQGSAEGRQT